MNQIYDDLTFDELAHAGPEHLDEEYIEGYDKKSAFNPTPDLELLRKYGFNEDSVLIDFGAGTGTFILEAALHCQKVIAVDISPLMISTMRQAAKKRGISNIEFIKGGILRYKPGGVLADFIYCRNTLHHLPDFWKAIALRKIFEVLRPGGCLRLRDIVFSFEASEAEIRINAWLESAASRPEDGWTRKEFETHLREEYSTYSWLLEPMIKKAGFIIDKTEYRPIKTYADYVCTKPR